VLQTLEFAVRRVLHDRKGVSATEYTAMVVGIAVLVVGGAQILGGDISTALSDVGSYLITAAAL